MNFMEHLDKLMYNAYEGSAIAMNPAPKVSTARLFLSNFVQCFVITL